MTVRMPSELLRGLESLRVPEATKHCMVVPFRYLEIDLIMTPVELYDATKGYGS